MTNQPTFAFGDELSGIHTVYISKGYFRPSNEQSCDCESIVIQCDGGDFLFRHRESGPEGDIAVSKAASFSDTDYPYTVNLPSRFTFDRIRFHKSGGIDGIRFRGEDVFLFVFSSEYDLVLTMSKYDLFEELPMDYFDVEAVLPIVLRAGFPEETEHEKWE